MHPPESQAFVHLFHAACVRCFGKAPEQPLSEPESRHLSHEIEEKTGLVVGWKSLKNYSVSVWGETPGASVNPSVATLDTLARYVYEAPVTSETERKKHADSYPFWFRYREEFAAPVSGKPGAGWPKNRLWLVTGLGIAVMALLLLTYRKESLEIVEHFSATDVQSLAAHGWFTSLPEPAYWERRGETPGQLTLFTLPGDNWRAKNQAPGIRNLLTRKIPEDCFSAEVHFSDFIPQENWQQAGLLLMEDTTYSGKSIRLSLGYNDFFGGYRQPGEIILQAVASYGKAYQHVEEIAHHLLFRTDAPENDPIVINNLKHTAVRIEKRGRKFRLLYAASPVDNFSFKELTTYEFDLNAGYIGIFALKGFVDTAQIMPVAVRFFRLDEENCN